MTLHELSRLCLLRRDREELHDRLEEQWTAATRITSRIDGMPRAPFHQQSNVEKYAASIADMKNELVELDRKILQEECSLRRYISTVPDSETRLILQYRFLNCLSWRDVARALGDNTTEGGVKMTIKRFLNTEGQSSQLN